MSTVKVGAANSVDVYVSRRIGFPPSGSAICPALGSADYCFSMHGVSWRETRVRERDQRVVYHFRAPDAEAVRRVLRYSGIEFDDLWIGGSPWRETAGEPVPDAPRKARCRRLAGNRSGEIPER